MNSPSPSIPPRHAVVSLTALQRDIAARLNADPWLLAHHVEAIAEDRGDLETAVAEAIARLGLCAIIATPGLTPIAEDGLLYATADLHIILYEEPLTNRARASSCTALNAAEYIHTLLRTFDGCTIGPLRQIDAGDSHIALDLSATFHIIHGHPASGGQATPYPHGTP